MECAGRHDNKQYDYKEKDCVLYFQGDIHIYIYSMPKACFVWLLDCSSTRHDTLRLFIMVIIKLQNTTHLVECIAIGLYLYNTNEIILFIFV